MKIRFNVVILILIAVAAILVSPLIIAFLPKSISEYAYRDLTYLHLSNRLISNDLSEQERAEVLFKYVAANIYAHEGFQAVDCNPFNDLIRGIGWCDQQALLLNTLLNKQNIKSRLRDVQHHTCGEALIGDKWVLLDPYAGSIYYNKGTRVMASIDEIVQGEQLLYSPLKFEIPDMQKLYVPDEGRYSKGISPEYIDYVNKSVLKKAIEMDIRLGYILYGKKYAFWYQDKYLESIKELSDPGEKWIIGYKSIYKPSNEAYLEYYKGRNYYVYGRYNEALKTYCKITDIYHDTYWADESAWQKGMVYFFGGKDENALSIFSDPQISEDPLFKHRSKYMLNLVKGYSVEN
ncbi:MAG: hypothetical protein ABFD08_02315 [Syntrophomonas sp.]